MLLLIDFMRRWIHRLVTIFPSERYTLLFTKTGRIDYLWAIACRVDYHINSGKKKNLNIVERNKCVKIKYYILFVLFSDITIMMWNPGENLPNMIKLFRFTGLMTLEWRGPFNNTISVLMATNLCCFNI